MSATDSGAGRDDRLLSATRWASLAIVVILLPAVVVLWGFPHDTKDLWSWEIHPAMTPIFMGSGYAAGAYFFFRVFRERRWHPASAGVLSAAIFAALELVVTVVHWDAFNMGDAPTLGTIAYYGWVGVYILSPFAVGALWWANHRRDPRRPVAGEAVVPPVARGVALVVGIGAVGSGLVFLLSPATMIDAWPWALKPLAARAVACFVIQVGCGAILLSLDARWSAWRLLLETFLVATAFMLVGAVTRAWGDFDKSDPATWLFFGGLVGLAVAVLALFLRQRSAVATRA